MTNKTQITQNDLNRDDLKDLNQSNQDNLVAFLMDIQKKAHRPIGRWSTVVNSPTDREVEHRSSLFNLYGGGEMNL